MYAHSPSSCASSWSFCVQNGKLNLTSLEEACNRLQAMLTTSDEPSTGQRVFSPGQWNVVADRARSSSLVIIHKYYQTLVPEPGVEIKVQVDQQPISFVRPKVSQRNHACWLQDNAVVV